VVVVTSIVSVTDWVPSLTVKTQWPAVTGVTLNVPLPLAGEMVAIPLHEFAAPLAAVLTVNVPVKPVSVAVKLCAAPAPVAANDSAEGARFTAAVLTGVGEAVGVGAADGVALGTGVAVGVGPGTVVLVPPDPLQPTASIAKSTTEKPRHTCIAVQSPSGRGTAGTVSWAYAPEHVGYPYLFLRVRRDRHVRRAARIATLT
jgi:hypothetical protein